MEDPKTVKDLGASLLPLVQKHVESHIDSNASLMEKNPLLAKQHMGVRTQIKSAPMPGKFTLSSLVITLVASQSLFAFVSVFAFTVLEPILEPFIWPLFWLPVAAGSVYIISFLLVWKFKNRLRVSSSCMFIVAAIIVSQAILLSFLAMLWEPLLVLTQLIIYITSMYACAAYAQCTLGHYSYLGGRIIALATTLVLFVIFVLFLDKWILIPMAICTGVLALYEFFVIEKIDRLVNKHEGEEKFLEAVYYSLLTFKKTMFWVFIVFTIWYTLYKSCNKKPETNSTTTVKSV